MGLFCDDQGLDPELSIIVNGLALGGVGLFGLFFFFFEGWGLIKERDMTENQPKVMNYSGFSFLSEHITI